MVDSLRKRFITEIFFIFILIPSFIFLFELSSYFVIILILTSLIILKWYPIKKKEKFNFLFLFQTFLMFFFFICLLSLTYNNTYFIEFTKNYTKLWLIVLLFYPIISVVPQEIIYRHFFFSRYQKIVNNKKQLILLNSILFSYAHIIFFNIESIILSFLGSIIFCYTYIKHSLLMCILIHMILGQFILTSKLGKYFYTGTVSYLEKIINIQ